MNKIKRSSILQYSISIAIIGMSGNAYSMGLCVSGTSSIVSSSASPYANDCPSGKNGTSFTDSAKADLDKFGTDIATAGKEIAKTITSNTKNEIDMMTTSTGEIITALMNITNTKIKDELKQDKMMLDMKMNFQSEMQNRELQAKKSVIGLDDTKEEVLFILDELKNTGNGTPGNYNHAQEVIAAMKSKYDNDPKFLIPVRIQAASANQIKGSGCPEYSPELQREGKLDSSCFYGVKANPGEKVQKYFEECSRAKRSALSSIQDNVSNVAANNEQNRSQSKYLKESRSQSSKELASTKIKDQIDTSCTSEEFNYKLCGKTTDGSMMTETAYKNKIIENEIVPFGNISSTNYLAPVSFGTIDGETVAATDEEIAAMRAKSVDLSSGVAVSDNTPPIVKTYRTSSQYFAAKDFVNNITNKEAVSNDQNITKMKDSDTALFQSKFMSRLSALSLAENSLMQPIKERTGTNIAIAVADGTLKRDGVDGKVIKEDVDGAGSLDRLFFSIDKDYGRLSTDAKSAIGTTGMAGISTAPEGSLENWQIEALTKSNMLALKNYEQNERIELLLATLVASSTNSQENIDYINSLK